MPSYYGYQPVYQPYQPPMADQLAQLRQSYQPAAQQPQQSPILWVQGEEAAKAYMVAPGATVMLMDSEGQSFYLKSTDPQGMPLPLRIFDYVERTAQKPLEQPQISTGEFVTRREFEALAARVGELLAPVKEGKDE